ncbi:GTPase IMAP family member 9-like [Cheilinus undulatus]|uniref:GTPase IMAP family member 9-like n=1 Tax=Cheilinus undulatus TaxID=241271 RepID=UPI001BD515B6|nr:GTPase IMAP family member 9-like [Cheilinus undulatus]
MDREEYSKISELRIMLIGRVGDDKTKIMNVFLRSSEENVKQAPESAKVFISDSEKCHMEKITVKGQKMAIVDTPGLCHADKSDRDVMKEIKKCLSEVSPGPHVFLLVLPLEPFTPELQNVVKIFKSSFGDCVIQYTMVLFPDGEKLEDGDTDDFIGQEEELHNFVNDECKGRRHVLKNNDRLPDSTLLDIQQMVRDNEGKHYTGDEALRKREIALAVNGGALAGAAVGGAASQSVPSVIGIIGGLAVGAILGGVVGCLGYIAVKRAKKIGRVQQ